RMPKQQARRGGLLDFALCESLAAFRDPKIKTYLLPFQFAKTRASADERAREMIFDSSSERMNGGARRMWSPRAPSTQPWIGYVRTPCAIASRLIFSVIRSAGANGSL